MNGKSVFLRCVVFSLCLVFFVFRQDQQWLQSSVTPSSSLGKNEDSFVVRDFQDSHDETISIRVEKPRTTRVVTVRPGEDLSLLSNETHYQLSGEFHLDEEILVTDLHDVIVDGLGSAELWFTNPSTYGIGIVRCNRVSIRNFASIALDTAKVPLFSIVEVNAEGKAEYQDTPPPNTPTKTVSTYTANNTWGWDNSNTWTEFYFDDGTTVGDMPPLTSFSNSTVLFRHHTYTKEALRLRDCHHIHIESTNFGSGPGMAITAERSHHLFLRQVSISPSPGEPASTAGDGFHASGVEDVIMEACEFSYMGDDSINLHTKILPFVRTNAAPTELRWAGQSHQLWQFMIAVGEPSSTNPRQLSIVYYDDSMQPLGSGTTQEVVIDPWPVMTVNVPAPAAVAFVIIEDTVNRRILIQDNFFHHHRARGILIQGQDVAIRRNRFEHISMNGILVEPDAFQWREGVGLRNAMITENHFEGTGAALPHGGGAAISILAMRVARDRWEYGFQSDICVSNSNSFRDVHCNETYIPEGRIICR